MKWKEFLRDYLTFTRKERIGLLVVILTILFIWIFPKISQPRRQGRVFSDTSWMTAAKRLVSVTDSGDQQKTGPDNVDELAFEKPENGYPASKGELFYFDPNVLSPEGWKKLGIREKTIATIQNYLHKGGHFSTAGDLKRIYGFRPNEYARLQPYIHIATASRADPPTPKESEPTKQTFSNAPKHTVVDINIADTSDFIALPGVGNKLASRIVNFREKLGGFYSVEQIGETYGLPDSTFQKIKPLLKLEGNSIKKINVNTATKDEMKIHPYLKWNLANAIVEYRNQHGNFSSLEDLKKITLINAEVFDKIKFYLTL